MTARHSVLLGALFTSLAIAASPGCNGKAPYQQTTCPLGEVCGSGGRSSSASSTTATTTTTTASHSASSSASDSSSSSGVPLGCMDMKLDGNETDVDCGGSCPPCQNNKKCKMNGDCVSTNCIALMCEDPTCADGVQNGDETDVDCGGSKCPPCVPTKKCMVGTDCSSLICMGKQCTASNCSDGVKNGTESDIDCGGSGCPKCPLGKLCGVPTDCTSNSCSGQGQCVCPGTMINVPIVGANAGFCIDQFEVSYADYFSNFFSSNPSPATQDPICMWNQGPLDNGVGAFTPVQDWPQPPQNTAEAVRYVNWCQAYAYCKSVGHHLCGKIGGGGSTLAIANDAEQDQWFDACSAQGVNVYPYSGNFDPQKCNCALNTPAPPPSSTLGPSSYQGCLGGEPGLYEMSGNAAEWVDNCDAANGANDNCVVRGGSWEDADAGALKCDAIVTQTRSYAGADVGFRCCL